MLRKSKIAAIILSIAVLAGTAGGCGSAKPQEKAADKTVPAAAAAQEKAKEKLEFSIAYWDGGAAFPEGVKDDAWEKVKKDLNVSLKPINLTWNDYKDKVNLWAASSDLPDIWVSADIIGTPVYRSWIKNGIVKPLPADMSKYPNMQKVLNLEDVKSTKIEGKYYGFPRHSNDPDHPFVDRRIVVVRKDWMEKLGWKNDPQNYQEFTQLLKDLVTKDPDGNGKNDTIGITSESAINGDFFPAVIRNALVPEIGSGSWIYEDGKFVPADYSKKMPEYVKAYKQLYDEGLIDKDYALLKNKEGMDKFAAGKAAAIVTGAAVTNFNDLMSRWDKANPGKPYLQYARYIRNMKAPDGKRYRINNTNCWSETYFNSKMDDKKMARAMELVEYTLTPEFGKLSMFGFEGKDYKMEGDKMVVTRPKKENSQLFVTITDMYPSLKILGTLGMWNKYLQYDDPALPEDVRKEAKDIFNFLSKETVITKIYREIDYMSTPLKDTYQMKVSDAVVKIVLGKEDPVKAWNTFIEEENKKGLQKMIDEVNAEAAKQGIKP